MKKVGFIDYYLNEWHADNYPQWLKEASNGEYQVKYCWGEIDSPHIGALTNAEWADKNGIMLCSSPEEVIEKSDVLIVLAPDNPETHERLCQLPLKSGKRTYVDKTFAPDFETAKRIFKIAEQNNTPCITTSALRFADEYRDLDKQKITGVTSIGSGDFDIYCIHQIEPIVMLLGTNVKTIQAVSVGCLDTFLLQYDSGVTVSISCINPGSPFQMSFNFSDNTSKMVTVTSDVFKNMMHALIHFFETGEEIIPHEETLAVMRIREKFVEAYKHPGQCITL